MITIIDYGIGNLASIANMITHVGGKYRIIKSVSELDSADKILLPGVGAFDHGMNHLIQNGWMDALNKKVQQDKTPVLGICLGMQLMCKRSEEGKIPGLGWIDAEVIKFDYERIAPCKVPHMGWNTLSIQKENAIIQKSTEEKRFYFVHSYYVSCNNREDILALANHGHDFVAAFSHGHIYGAQFHPEKSHRFGMDFVKAFNEV